MYIHIHTCVCTYLCVYIYNIECVCVLCMCYICIYVYIYIYQGFWRYLGATGAEMVEARQSVRARCDTLEHDADVDFVLYRIDDLQDELEVTEVQKGGPLNRGALLGISVPL
jgi:hypothetical protein